MLMRKFPSLKISSSIVQFLKGLLWHLLKMDGISYHSFVGLRSTQDDIVFVIGSDEGPTFETSALKLFTVANLRYQLNR